MQRHTARCARDQPTPNGTRFYQPLPSRARPNLNALTTSHEPALQRTVSGLRRHLPSILCVLRCVSPVPRLHAHASVRSFMATSASETLLRRQLRVLRPAAVIDAYA